MSDREIYANSHSMPNIIEFKLNKFCYYLYIFFIDIYRQVQMKFMVNDSVELNTGQFARIPKIFFYIMSSELRIIL